MPGEGCVTVSLRKSMSKRRNPHQMFSLDRSLREA
jgi:hypothetical protein